MLAVLVEPVERAGTAADDTADGRSLACALAAVGDRPPAAPIAAPTSAATALSFTTSSVSSFVDGAAAAMRLHSAITAGEGTAGTTGPTCPAAPAGAAGAVRGDADGSTVAAGVFDDGAGVVCADPRSLDVPVRFATTRPATTAVTITSARPIAVTFQGFQLPSFIACSLTAKVVASCLSAR